MGQTFQQPNAIPTIAAFNAGLAFLKARRAQNLSFMRLAEQSLRTLADMQVAAGVAGAGLPRLWTAQAELMRNTASVYRSLTAPLAR
jgi:hypothetical protein